MPRELVGEDDVYRWADRYSMVRDYRMLEMQPHDFPPGVTEAVVTCSDGKVYFQLFDGLVRPVRIVPRVGVPEDLPLPPPLPDDLNDLTDEQINGMQTNRVRYVLNRLAPACATMVFDTAPAEEYFDQGGVDYTSSPVESKLLKRYHHLNYGGNPRAGFTSIEAARRVWLYLGGDDKAWRVVEDRRGNGQLFVHHFEEWEGRRRTPPRTQPAPGTLGAGILAHGGPRGYATCGDCGTRFNMYIHGGRRWAYCQACIRYTAAEAAVREAQMRYREQQRVAANRARQPRLINNYTYKPDPRFFNHGTDSRRRVPNTLYFGVEHEFEVERDLDPNDFMAKVINADAEKVFYGKQDGSLRHGVELVSHPMTFEYFQEKYPAKVADLIQTHAQVEWQGNKQCGVHIHMSRDSFGKPYHLYKFLHFIYSEADLVKFIAGRDGCVIHGDEMCSYDRDRYGSKMAWNPKSRKHEPSVDANVLDIARGKNTYAPRYMAANVQNSTTIELRVFASTVNHLRMRAYVQFADAAFYFTREGRMKHRHANRVINRGNFESYVEQNKARYPDLWAVLQGKATHDVEPAEYIARMQKGKTKPNASALANPIVFDDEMVGDDAVPQEADGQAVGAAAAAAVLRAARMYINDAAYRVVD